MHCGETLLPFTLHWAMPTLECVVHREGDPHRLVFHLSCGMRACASQAGATVLVCAAASCTRKASSFLRFHVPAYSSTFPRSLPIHIHLCLLHTLPASVFYSFYSFSLYGEVGTTALATATLRGLDVSLTCDESTIRNGTLCHLRGTCFRVVASVQ
ncbi:unnamed protein product [Trypanosoma congolense IL3000]|uniref:WGS project CAEQ00000000 data, annotated contig 1321 n=1 Tax=Trypanosoma congolense (strain IL3000) TaxID=1068625 RepID=F9W5F4_TRYCI|nr:unnamed protein product [Trypanosoma congolense IL3000]CCD14562.1 unnamed protein product [Trypanosoma congolense IL3000]